jgi:hypothetical protein
LLRTTAGSTADPFEKLGEIEILASQPVMTKWLFQAPDASTLSGGNPMGRLISLVSMLVMVGLPAACSFSKATEAEIRQDGSVGIDVHLPNGGDGNNTFESDATVTCVKTSAMTTNLPPDILLVLDRSGSMREDLTGMACGNAGCGATSKWTIATTTLEAFLPTVETTVNWGLKLFASGNNNNCTVDTRADVAPGPMNAGMIMTRLGQAMPGSSTPTTAAMMNAATYLKTLTDPNPQFILLATDGIPTCGMSQCAPGVNAGNNTMQCDDANAIAMVKAVHDMGFPTFVLGIGTANSPGDATLSMMAVNGGYPRAATPNYYPIGSAQDLTDAFKAITGMVGNCFFAISPALTPTQFVTGVTADGRDLTSADYMLVGTTGVQLIGQACMDFTAGNLKNVAVQVSCNG